jgi:hypothetical protein
MPARALMKVTIALALAAASCDDDSGTWFPDGTTDTISDTMISDTMPDPSTDPTPDISIDDGSGGCTHTGFTATAEVGVDYRPTDEGFVYQGGTAAAPPADIIAIEFYGGMGDPVPTFAPGTFAIAATAAERNYETCGTCVLVRTNCSTSSCEKYFFATGGSMTITTWGSIGGTFAGSLTGVNLEEVTINPDTFHSDPVAGGETWCLPSYSFNATIQAPSGG